MTNMSTGISWTDSTWNPTVGCTQISAGCEHCYAKALVDRFGGTFETMQIYESRLDQVNGFSPVKLGNGTVRPRLVFVNSMSDLFHDDIPDGFRDKVFERMERRSDAVFQVLTKRPMTMRRYLERYRRVPANIWLGVSVEDNRVRGRIDTLRRLKEALGSFTAFLSVEPLIGPVLAHLYAGIDWVIIGGESGTGARPMKADWARQARDKARLVGAAIYFKQWGLWSNNPLYQGARGDKHIDRVRQAIETGELGARIVRDPTSGREKIVGEKGGATLDGEVLHEMPVSYRQQKTTLF